MEYGLIGGKLSHSFSVPIHRALANYSYELCPLPPGELDGFLRARNFCGINVTIPYKRDVIPYCDVLSPEAEAIGSVNTIVNRGGKLYGYNTDIYGFEYMAERQGICMEGKKVLILGSGGTGHTARAAAVAAGAAEIVVVSRSGEHNYSNLDRHADAQILVNTTPVGMFPDNGKTPVDLSKFPDCQGVLDVIYNPLSTELVLEAKVRNIPCTGGLAMLVAQAKRSCELFTDTVLADQKTEQVFRALWAQMSNIVLIGMPGCGKTTVGQRLAQELSLPFFDTDAWIVSAANRSIPELFAEEGESGFRIREREACAEAARKTGYVIAVGGGALLDERNLRALQGNGVFFFLDRPLAALATDGRPLSSAPDRLLQLWEERRPLYQSCCDRVIDGTGTVEDVVQKGKDAYAEIFSN